MLSAFEHLNLEDNIIGKALKMNTLGSTISNHPLVKATTAFILGTVTGTLETESTFMWE